jgi:hypothetical protein
MAARLICFIVLFTFLAGCSSDPETPLGSEFVDDSIIGSRPGTVFKDTLYTPPDDTSFTVSSLLTSNSFLTIGSRSGYRTSMVMRVNLSNVGADADKIVRRAQLRLRFTDQSQTAVIGARFYEMLEPFSEGDTITALNRSSVPVPDSGLVNVDREMKLLGDYTLPAPLVQAWIKGDVPHHGIAVIPSDTTVATQITYGSSENTDGGLQPFLNVEFTNGTSTNYPMSDDATFVEWLDSTSNLIISDGFTQRTYIPVDLSGIESDAAIHKAELVLNLVPGTEIGNEFDVRLYTPNSSVIGSSAIFDGTGITTWDTDVSSGQVALPVRNVLLLFLNGGLPNTGFVAQFAGEGSQIRQLEFYSASAPAELRPSIRITYSSPAEFKESSQESR